jgi:hypothetical protein
MALFWISTDDFRSSNRHPGKGPQHSGLSTV